MTPSNCSPPPVGVDHRHHRAGDRAAHRAARRRRGPDRLPAARARRSRSRGADRGRALARGALNGRALAHREGFRQLTESAPARRRRQPAARRPRRPPCRPAARSDGHDSPTSWSAGRGSEPAAKDRGLEPQDDGRGPGEEHARMQRARRPPDGAGLRRDRRRVAARRRGRHRAHPCRRRKAPGATDEQRELPAQRDATAWGRA